MALTAGCSLFGVDSGPRVPTTYEEALELLGSSSPDDRMEAVQFIGAERDPRGLEPLGKALQDDNLLVRLEATLSLRNFDSPATIPLLRPLLADPDPDMRFSAAVALFELDDYSGTEVLVEGLTSSRPNYRLTSALFLSRIRWPGAVPGLIIMLRDIDPRNRSQAAYSLGQVFRAETAVGPLLEAMNDPVPYVRKDAWESLKAITGDEYPYSFDAEEDLREAQLEIWRLRLRSRSGTPASPGVSPVVPGPSPEEAS